MARRWLVAVFVALAAACTGSDDAGPPPTTDPASSTTVIDLSGVALPGVGGETTTTIDETGTARLVGTVRGPAGPVAGATVRVDRLVAGREIRHDVHTATDGRWELQDVPGGRYRLRAFLAPVYAQTTAEVAFLADGEEHAFDLVVEDQRGVVVRADAAPDEPLVDAPVNVVVVVAHRTVDGDGVVRARPAAGDLVELAGLGRWVLDDVDDEPDQEDDPDDDLLGTTTSTTLGPSRSTSVRLSDSGRARFELRCRSAGVPGLVLRVPVPIATVPGATPSSSTVDRGTTIEEVTLDLPACVAEASPSPTTSTTAP